MSDNNKTSNEPMTEAVFDYQKSIELLKTLTAQIQKEKKAEEK